MTVPGREEAGDAELAERDATDFKCDSLGNGLTGLEAFLTLVEVGGGGECRGTVDVEESAVGRRCVAVEVAGGGGRDVGDEDAAALIITDPAWQRLDVTLCSLRGGQTELLLAMSRRWNAT